MNHKIEKLTKNKFPKLLLEIDDPPKKLYIRGMMPDKESLFLSFVGSRKATDYGRRACIKIIEQLAGYPVVIVSGLALGIDSIAHKVALDVGLPTIAVPGSGLNDNVIYPASHRALAKEILQKKGALISEYEPEFKATSWSFPQRNRIMAGISQGVIVVEAEERSGTLITARLGLEYNREVCAVPGSIFSATSKGANNLIKQGAFPITSGKDIKEIFGLLSKTKKKKGNLDLSPEERKLIDILNEPMSKNRLADISDLPISKVNIAISSLELKGLVSESGGVIYFEEN